MDANFFRRFDPEGKLVIADLESHHPEGRRDIDDMNLGAGTEPMLFEETEQADIPFPSFGYIIELDMLAVDRLV